MAAIAPRKMMIMGSSPISRLLPGSGGFQVGSEMTDGVAFSNAKYL